MPTESLRIKGQFFNLRTELSLSPSKGYMPLSSVISRSVDRTELYEEELDINEVCSIINKNIAVLDLNFSSWNLITRTGVISRKIDITKIHSKKVNQENLISALKLYPVISISKTDQAISIAILDQYIKLTKLNLKDLIKIDFFVLTGEMVWSRWLNDNMVSKLLSEFSPDKVLWHLDRSGIWNLLIHQPLKNSIAGGINQRVLTPDLFYHMPGKREKKISLIKKDVKRDILIDGRQRFLSDIEGYVYTDVILPKYFVVGGAEINSSKSLNNNIFIKSSMSIKREHKAEVILPDKELKIRGEVGYYEQKKFKVIELLDYSKKLKILVGHGQKVEKDEVIAQNLSLSGRVLGEKFVSPISGYVDLSRQNDGIMILWSKLDEKTNMNILQFGKYTGGQNGKFHKFETKLTTIPMDIVLGESVSGFLVRETGADFKDLPKILMLNYSMLKSYTTEELINDHVTGLLFDHLSFSQINKILDARSEVFTLFNVCAIDAFTWETNPVFLNELNSSIGLMAVIGKNSIKIINNTRNSIKKFEEKLVKYISYNSKFRYYRETRKMGKNEVLLSNGKNIIETNICNLIYIKNGSNS